MFLSLLTLGPSVRKEEDTVGFSLKLGDTVLGLDALSVNDKTLWNSKLSEAISSFAVNEKKFLTKQKSGGNKISRTNWTSLLNWILNDSVHENETKESKGRLLLIIVKGDNIFDTNGKKTEEKNEDYILYTYLAFF